MSIQFGRDVCGDLAIAESKEWLVTNGIGGYASGTIAGLLTRRYHGLLIAALHPPLGRTLLLTKVDEIVDYRDAFYSLYTNRWMDGAIDGHGYRAIESFELEGTLPVWRYACADALLEKRIWMQPGANTTYIRYHLQRGTAPLTLSMQAFVNHRDYHGSTQAGDWPLGITPMHEGVKIQVFPEAVPLYLLTPLARVTPAHAWYRGFHLAIEQQRGFPGTEDHLYAASFYTTLQPGESLTLVASTEADAELDGGLALETYRSHTVQLQRAWSVQSPDRPMAPKTTPDWIHQLVLAADQFIVDRPVPDNPKGKTILAGYPWFSDWGRDTMISLPGLTLTTGRPDIARSILQTFAHCVDQGMIPNRFPDAGEIPEYNTVDATLWYIEAIRQYLEATGDEALLETLFPVLVEILDWHCRGTRYHIHRDPQDGLLYAGEPGVQLTWMDAKVGDWVVTPRMGKPVEVNALWYSALRSMAAFADRLHQPSQAYTQLADQCLAGFQRFWNPDTTYCFDVLDGPEGPDPALRPNAIFAVSLPHSPLSPDQQRQVVDLCAQQFLTSHGLRSLAPSHASYRGFYGGSPRDRDGAYHQGTVWGWLLGAFALAHYRVYGDAALALGFLQPMQYHLMAQGMGSLSEIFDGDPPFAPKGCTAQAWSVAEVLRAWAYLQNPNPAKAP